MSAPTTPYTRYLGERDPLAAMRDTLDRVAAVLDGWPANRFERSYAPGKWNARQILTHLAQVEMAFGTRMRMALTVSGYDAQSFDQDLWMKRESGLDGRSAADAYLSTSRMNRAFFETLSEADLSTPFSHP